MIIYVHSRYLEIHNIAPYAFTVLTIKPNKMRSVLVLVPPLDHWFHRQSYDEFCAVPGVGLQRTSHRRDFGDNEIGRFKPKTVPADGLGCEKVQIRLLTALSMPGRYPRFRYMPCSAAVPALSGTVRAFRSPLHGLGAVSENIEQHLLNLACLAWNCRQVASILFIDFDQFKIIVLFKS